MLNIDLSRSARPRPRVNVTISRLETRLGVPAQRALRVRGHTAKADEICVLFHSGDLLLSGRPLAFSMLPFYQDA